MVATQVLISLCVAGMAIAAPQLALPGLQRTSTSSVNEGQIVTNVVTALQPSIAEAVANALRSLQLSSTTTSGSSFGSSRGSSSSSRGSSASAGAVDSLATDAKYNYEYKVADEEAQTYISQQESRDGDQLTGTYSYVNPDGALITVNYEAGPMGYTQTLDKQDGFVTIRSQNVGSSNAGSSAVSSGSRVTSSSSGSRFSGSSSQSASFDQSALISQIVSALQPQIQASVNSALASQQSSAVTSRRIVTAPVPAQAGAAGGSLSSVFGDGYNVRFVTPEFNVEY